MTYIPHPTEVPFEYNQIAPFIFLGTNKCCQDHFEQSLLKKGVRAEISLEQENLDKPYGVTYFFWLPVKDKKAPTQEQLLTGAKVLKNFVDQKIKTYVHCKRGHGRSPTLVAAYFILEGASHTEAIKRVRDKRAIHMTKPQIAALKEFAKR